MKPVVGYLCDHCGERVLASAEDPAALTTKGNYHANRCLQEAYVTAARAKDAIKDEKHERRSQAAKARWAKRRAAAAAASKENNDST